MAILQIGAIGICPDEQLFAYRLV
uniref:Uncharacterized protein n=1 Tax=Ralstonia solanacearum TaxID=305 RepID=A0A0S4WSC8_RALSL|nr:conserved protein of unknown function [Ralstonia solanacearum]CUV18770.1 conserved protein of unknown function [Ralstonia solanacearum]CUV23849.1 conserved protein of unknown function [Ralstonia solanacearum]CUV30413.1 conserved protein of unknown function [Ralstonia solanacearum]CUV34046.1 conserved protein of unknown function [Ralstonia solanacearum]